MKVFILEAMKKYLRLLVGHSRILKLLRPDQRGRLFIFNYHRVRQNGKEILFDEGVFGPDEARFRQELHWIKNETHILNEVELLDILNSKKPMNKIYSMVTFDDGYRDNFDVAFPILSELGIPATFFIPTWHLSERKLGWWDVVAYLIKRTHKAKFSFRDRTYELADQTQAITQLLTHLKNIESTRVDGFLQSLSEALDVPLPSQELQSNELMTWDQLRIMRDQGMSIGSHSHLHVILSKQSIYESKLQLQLSKEILERQLGAPVHTLAYPVGGYSHFDYETKRIARELGFKLGFSYLTGINRLGQIDPFNVKRIGIQPQWPNLDYLLAFPHRAFPEQAENI